MRDIPKQGGGLNTFFIFTPSWGNDPISFIFCKWVGSTTNKKNSSWHFIVDFHHYSDIETQRHTLPETN